MWRVVTNRVCAFEVPYEDAPVCCVDAQVLVEQRLEECFGFCRFHIIFHALMVYISLKHVVLGYSKAVLH